MTHGLKAIRLAWFWLLAFPLTVLPEQPLEWIRPNAGGDGFVRGERTEPFHVWGFNYDHDEPGRLLEDYWESEWDTVAADFAEMKALDANVVRIHLQLGRFMDTPDQPNAKALAQLKRLVLLAEETGLYLNLTGLGCYHKKDVPPWYDKLGETARWKRTRLDFYPSALPRDTATVLESESCSGDAGRSTSHVGRASHVMRRCSTFGRRRLRNSTDSFRKSNIA